MARKTRSDKTAHCVMEGDTLLCKHCGATWRPNLPKLVPDFVREINGFIALHRDCPAPVETAQKAGVK